MERKDTKIESVDTSISAGGIGEDNLLGYCVARSFAIIRDYGTGDYGRNRYGVGCKICGVHVEPGLAVKSVVASMRYGHGSSCYLCDSCAGFVDECRLRFPS